MKGHTVLQVSAKEGLEAGMAALLALDAPKRLDDWMGALMIACHKGFEGIALGLLGGFSLGYNLSPNVPLKLPLRWKGIGGRPIPYEMTPFLMAAKGNQFELARTFLRMGAKPDPKYPSLDVSYLLSRLAVEGNVDASHFLIDEAGIPLFHRDKNRNMHDRTVTALYAAVRIRMRKHASGCQLPALARGQF